MESRPKAPFDIMHELAPLGKLMADGFPFVGEDLDDTGLVIQATSLIDRFLRLALISGFRSDTVSKTLLATIFEGYGPLSSFSSRIAVCIALGLTTPDVRHDLAVIKTIRNEFAHSPLALALSNYPQIKLLKVSSTKVPTDNNEYRMQFKQSCVGVIGFLCEFSLLAIARDRFVAKNKEGVFQELAALKLSTRDE